MLLYKYVKNDIILIMNIQSYTILHYGKDYLPYSIRSIYDNVDVVNVFYTPHPSHGHQTSIPPAETKKELIVAAHSYDPGGKVKWYDMTGIANEGTQRDKALDVCKRNGAEMVLVADYDEIWDKQQLELSLSTAWDLNFRNHLVNMIHFWRSFNWVCYDDGWPVRIIDLRAPNKAVNYTPRDLVQPYHFGYAITDKVMRYKWQIHGHKNEMRNGWIDNVWENWSPGSLVWKQDEGKKELSVHPTNENDFWVPEPFDKTKLPHFMRDHPFYNLEKIE